MVSMEIGIFSRPASRSITGSTRFNSSASLTGSAPGRVDSPPMSIMSAPSPANFTARAAAASGCKNCPPSEKESGVTFTIPITSAGRGNENSNWRALKIIRPLDQFDLIPLRRVHKGNPAAVGPQVRAVRIFIAVGGEVAAKLLQAVHFKGQVGQIWLHPHRAARGKAAKLDQFLALRRLHEDQFRAAR